MQGLETTNLILGIIALVAVLEACVLAGFGIASFVVYRKISDVLESLDRRHVTPAMARVNHILDDVSSVTATVKAETTRVDHAIRNTMDRVDDTAGRVRSSVRAKTSRIIGLVRGARVVIETILQSRAA